jgi:arogenate dehydrogenase (NADP+)
MMHVLKLCRDITAFLDADMDVILLCTSISSLSEVVGSMPLTCLKRPTLFVDVLSVKEHPKNLLLRVSSFQLHLSIMEP